VIVIAHRLSTVEHSDHIVALNEGVVSEEGKFEDLIKRDGDFARMYKMQYSKRSAFID
jgi:ATP-binding cassette subfamily B protein